VNCITELLPERALERAKYLDEYLATHKKPIGPLHGIPISVKEHVGMKGLELNAGFVAWCGQIAGEDSHILQILWGAGCVFYARTTQPQTLMHLECSSNIHGVTTNPFNTKLSSGGSSGGEGALMGLRGSCLGIGTDIGGSIRSPAANNGLYGFRPSSYRLPVAGWGATMQGSEHIVPVIGPLSTSLEGIKTFMKVILDRKPWLKEPSLIPFGWRDDQAVKGRKLKVAVMWDDGVVKPHPPVLRALKEIVTKLGDSVEIVDWTPLKHDEAWKIIVSIQFLLLYLVHQGPRIKLTLYQGKPLLLRRRPGRTRGNGRVRRASTTPLKAHPHRQSLREVTHRP
jgi:amidase